MISHAIDEIYGSNTKALHGIQVMIATLYLEKIMGMDLLSRTEIKDGISDLEKILSSYGMPTKFSDIGINNEELKVIIEKAPSTRKGRFTVLDQIKSGV